MNKKLHELIKKLTKIETDMKRVIKWLDKNKQFYKYTHV